VGVESDNIKELDRERRAGNAVLGRSLPEIPTLQQRQSSRNNPLENYTSSQSSMAFFGLRKWPTPVSQPVSIHGEPCTTRPVTPPPTASSVRGRLTLAFFHQVLRPLWPFFAASGITYFLVSKAQDIGVRCALFHLYEKSQPAHTRLLCASLVAFTCLAEGFRNDPRNPYAAQIAKEEHAHH
jgi:F-type H+-transporting ATPase subunit j